MKSEQDTFFSQQNLFQIPPSIQKSKNLSPNSHFSFLIQCPFQKQAFEYCCEESCFQNAVICQDENCKCQMAHEDCENFIKTNRFHNKINSKIVANSEKMTKEIEDNVHKIIDLVSDMLQKITESMKIFGLNKGQRQIIRVIKSQFDQNLNQHEREIITGQKLFKYRSEQKLHQQSWYEQSLSHFKKIISQTKISIEPIFNQLQNTITHIHIENSPQQPPQRFFLQSKILSLHDQLNAKGNNQSSIGFLINSLKQSMINIGSIKKLCSYQKQSNPQKNNQGFRHRSRDNQWNIFGVIPKNNSQQSIQTFNIKDFAKICQLKENLLFVVRNSYGMRFGAFTPCKFNSTLNQWTSDAFKKSFIFSLNCQQVQKLTNISQGLRFIGNEIQIGRDPSNANQNGFTLTLGQHDVLGQIEFEKNPIIANPSPNLFPVKTNPTYIQANGVQKDPKKVGFSVVELEVYEILLKRFSISQPIPTSKIEQKNIFQKQQPPKKNIFDRSFGAESQNFIINSPNGGLFQTNKNSVIVGFPVTGQNIFSKNTQYNGMLHPRK